LKVEKMEEVDVEEIKMKRKTQRKKAREIEGRE